MTKRKITILALVLVVAGLAWVGLKDINSGAQTTQVQVAASFYPMAEFARQIGGNNVKVTTIVHSGVEPHDFDPAPRDMADLQRSQLVVYNGAGIEPWLEKSRRDLESHGVEAVEASDGIKIIKSDPHVWLDPVLAAQEVDRIAAGLIKVDPAHKTEYERNAAVYKQKLAELDKEISEGLAQCRLRAIVTAHEAFAYFSRRYGLDMRAVAGLSPDEEPSPQKLASLTQTVRQYDVKYVFFESLTSSKLAEALAREANAQTLVLNPLEGLTSAEAARGDDYFSVQRKNLENLRMALDCK